MARRWSAAKVGRSDQVWWVVVTAVLTVVFLVRPGTWSGPDTLLNAAMRLLLLMLPAAVVLTALHEGAHAVVARLTGWQLFGLTLGQGRRRAAVDLGRLRVELRGVLIGGATFANPTGRRARDAAMLAAGISVEAVVVAGALAWSPSSAWAQSARWAVVVVAGIDIVANLWPRQVDIGPATGIATDGAQLLAVLTRPEQWRDDVERRRLTHRQAAIVQTMHGGELDEAVRLAAEASAAEPAALTDMLLGALLLDQYRWREAYEILGPLADGDADDHVLANNAAVAALMTFDTALHADADRWSARAVELRPGEPACVSTRGSALTVVGRVDEGRPLLDRAGDGRLSARQRAFVEAFTALAAHRQGRPAEARTLLDASRAHHAECPAIPQVTRLMTPWPPPDPGTRMPS